MRFEEVVFFALLACLVGFVEEVFFRGLILQAFAPSGFWRAAVVSSVVFGATHSLNLLFGADPLATMLQMVYAMALGFGFAAVTLRTGVIWPLIVIHALIDFAGFVTAEATVMTRVSPIDVVIYGGYVAVFTTYGIVMMRAVSQHKRFAHTRSDSSSKRGPRSPADR
ncbi:CPBP family intramembrane metalloprotease [Cryobacterium sp. TmT2-59]|uniref:CPBP family intramembrane glutamic endopeptidase n=1 Tax=Cryobacterium sp. TmT2-59 TaxID=1259264 RepID=UPI00106ADE62|nr:CPBP family intramembrane glutamic endopeptidase [Cryobacterium sp. TmT2-59]TFC86407.1 CPBP family intramembrane metalloprotease [Cryobacterium sp. TmT2-59]